MTSQSKITKVKSDYNAWLDDLKQYIQTVQIRTALADNSELMRLYWKIGTPILQKQQKEKWGGKVIDRLAQDLITAFPSMKGFSPSNLKYTRRFAESYPECKIGQQFADQLPCFHNIVLLTEVKLYHCLKNLRQILLLLNNLRTN